MSTNAALPTNETQTLTQRLAQGRIPAPDAQRYAMILAEALRRMHEAGQVHGGVSPAAIKLTGSGLALGAAPDAKGTITPYTAPELLQGQPADARSDLFAFGAVVYEMFSGRRAFEGDSPAALSAAIETHTPPSCGMPAVDRLIRNCLAKDPGTRWHRMHKVLMALKLQAVSARRPEAPAAARREAAEDAALGARMEELEGRLAARLQACDERILRLEQGLDAARQHIATLHDSVAQDFAEFEQGLKSQSAAIQSARTAMAQTDDLVERVVEALESLQSAVREPREERALVL